MYGEGETVFFLHRFLKTLASSYFVFCLLFFHGNIMKHASLSLTDLSKGTSNYNHYLGVLRTYVRRALTIASLCTSNFRHAFSAWTCLLLYPTILDIKLSVFKVVPLILLVSLFLPIFMFFCPAYTTSVLICARPWHRLQSTDGLLLSTYRQVFSSLNLLHVQILLDKAVRDVCTCRCTVQGVVCPS